MPYVTVPVHCQHCGKHTGSRSVLKTQAAERQLTTCLDCNWAIVFGKDPKAHRLTLAELEQISWSRYNATRKT